MEKQCLCFSVFSLHSFFIVAFMLAVDCPVNLTLFGGLGLD